MHDCEFSEYRDVALGVHCSTDRKDFLQLHWRNAEGELQHSVLLLDQHELMKMPNIAQHPENCADPAANSIFVLEPNRFGAGKHKLGIVLRAGRSLQIGDAARCAVGSGALWHYFVARGMLSFSGLIGMRT